MKLMPGVLPHWQDVPADNFAAEFPSTAIVGVNLDQRSAKQLYDCIVPWNGPFAKEPAWAGKLGASIYAKGRQVLWSVPFPGERQLEAVIDGKHDALYIAAAQSIREVAKGFPSLALVFVRLGWEFNLWGNTENRALDKAGKPNAQLCARAWSHIAGIFSAAFRNSRASLRLVWSPSVERSEVVPWKAAWPGVEFVDVIAPDLYLCHGFGHTPGVYTGGWFRDVLLDMRAFAREKNKAFGYGELGADSDDFATDVQMALADAEAFTGPAGGMVMWWNDYQVVDCRITDGRLPALAAKYKAALS